MLKKSDWKRLLPGVIISVISLTVVLYLAKPGKLYQALLLADIRLILLALAGGLVWLVVRTMAWRTLLQNKATFSQVFFTVNEGYLLNNVLPFRLGEVARAFLLSHKANLKFWEVFPTIILERILDLAFAAGLLLATLPFVVGASWARQAALVSGLVVIAGLVVLWLLARYKTWALTLFQKFAQRWPALQRIAGPAVESIFNGLSVLTDSRLFLLSIFWVGMDWLVSLGQYYIFLLAFIPNAKFLWSAFTLGVAAFGVAAPSSPGAVGVYELAVVGALALFGVQAATALAFALTAHLSQYLLVGIFGTIGLVRDGESLIGLYSRARNISPEEMR